MSFEEFLDFEGAPDLLYEYVDGLVYPRDYGTDAHASIATNVMAVLLPRARPAGCRVYGNSMALRTPRGNGYGPDVMVYCGPRVPPTNRYLTSPCLLVEVLSPSTGKVDFTEKLEHYRDIETLQAYWIVEAEWRCVHRHWRDANGGWRYEEVRGDGVLPVPCPVPMTLTLADVYDDVDVPGEPPGPRRPPLRRIHEPDADYVVARGADVARAG